MKQNEREFLVIVAICAIIACTLFFHDVREHFSLRAALHAPAAGTGKPREADIEKIKRLIRQGELSNHEATYYKPASPYVHVP